MKQYKNMQEFMDSYDRMKKVIEAMDMSNLSANDREMLAEYAEMKDYLNDVRVSLDFVKSSTMVALTQDENSVDTLQCRSLLDNAHQYAYLTAALTNNFDERFMKAVEATREGHIKSNDLMTSQEYIKSIAAPLNVANIRNEFDTIQETIDANGGSFSKEELDKAMKESKEAARKNGIDINSEDIIFATLTVVVEKDMYEQNNVLGQENLIAELGEREKNLDGKAVEKEEAEKASENSKVEVVVSNDGYAMATSKVENEAQRQDLNSKVDTATQEMRKTEIVETTNDPSRVGGNVKLETVNELGSRELARGEIEGDADKDGVKDTVEEAETLREIREAQERADEERDEEELDGNDDMFNFDDV